MHFHRKTGLPCRPVSVPLYAVLGDKCVHQRGFLRLFSAVHKAAAVLGCGSFKLVRSAVEGGKAFALMDVVTALFVQGDLMFRYLHASYDVLSFRLA